MSPHTVLEPLWALREQLWASGLVIIERWPHGPRDSGFGWEILVCTVLVVFMTVKCGLRLRGRKGHCAQNEVSGKDMEKTDPDAPAHGAVASSEHKASPLPLQILALAALNQDVGYFSVGDATQLLKGVRQRLLKKSPHQLTDENPICGAAQDDGEPPARNMPEDFEDSPDLRGSADPLSQDIGSCGLRVQEEAGEAGRPELPDGGVPWQAPAEGQSQHHTLSQILLTVMHLLELLRDHLEGGGSRRQVQTGSSSTDHVPRGSPLNKGKPSRALKKARQGNEELPGNTTIHQAEQVSFHQRNSLLEREIQKLHLKLEAEPKLCEEHLKHLERKMMEETARCLQVKNELAKVRRKVDAAHWNLGLYKKMADDLHHQECQRISSLHDRERLLVDNRSEESQKAVLWAEREFQRLKEENHCLRQKLANSGPKVQPVSGGPPAPAPAPAPAAAPALLGTASKCPQGPQAPLKAQKPKKGARVHWPDSKFSGPLQV